MTQPGANQHEGRVSIREGTYHSGAASDLPVEALNHVIRTDPRPMLRGEVTISQSLFCAVLHLLGRFLQLHFPQLGYHGLSFLTGCFFALLGVDRLEHLSHQFHLGTGNHRKYIAVEMNGTALVFGFGEHLAHSLQHSQTLVSNNELHPIQATTAEPLEEAHPAGLVLLHAFSGTQNLTISVLVYCDGHQNSYIFVLSAPVAAQVYPVHIDVRVAPSLQGAIPPVLNVDICFLIQFADGCRGHLAAPQSLRDVLYPAH